MEDANFDQVCAFMNDPKNAKYFSSLELAQINMAVEEYKAKIVSIVAPVMARDKKTTFLFKMYKA